MSELQPGKQDEQTRLFAEGEAALWLSESLILALLEASLLNTETILEAIDIVIAAKKAKADEGRNPDISRAAAASCSRDHRRCGTADIALSRRAGAQR